MDELKNYLTKENVEKFSLGMFFIGLIGVIYSIIAGIWGFAPSLNFNWKVFGTSLIIGVIGVIIAHINDED